MKIAELTEKYAVGEIADLLRACYSRKIHPTIVLIKAIENVYGHKVPLQKMIKLIEGSPLRK